jgi:hypothetical protein
MDSVCWIVAIVVIIILVYMGCTELRKSSAISARKTQNDTKQKPRKSALRTSRGQNEYTTNDSLHIQKGVMIDESFQEVQVDRSLDPVVETMGGSQISENYFMSEFYDASETAFKPINKEEALRKATVRPGNGESDRAAQIDPPARMIGLSPMNFARSKLPNRHGSSHCVSFNDTDHRQVSINAETNCFDSYNCPWMN